MNRKKFLIIVFILLFSIACEESLDKYVTLEYSDFMKLSNDNIADSIATILDVQPVTYNQVVSVEKLFHDDLRWAVKEGHEYISNDSARVTVWVNEEDNPYYVTYELERGGTSEDWSYQEDSVISDFKSNIEKAGVDLSDTYDLTLNKVAGFGDHWYQLSLTQTYNDTVVAFPYFYSETESDTNKINLLLINRWYTNLDDITDILSDQALKEKAREYFEKSEKVVSIPDELTVKGYHIVKNKICRQVGSAVIDEWGSTLDLYIDVQNGEIVEEASFIMRD